MPRRRLAASVLALAALTVVVVICVPQAMAGPTADQCAALAATIANQEAVYSAAETTGGLTTAEAAHIATARSIAAKALQQCQTPSPSASASPTPSPTPSVSTSPPPTGVSKVQQWGMFNVPTNPVPAGYCTTNNVTVPVVEMSWQSAEPIDDAWSTPYFNTQRAKYDAYKAAGCTKISLNWGMHHPPTFIKNAPNAKFVDQLGDIYTGSDEVDLLSNKSLRAQAEQYALRVFQEFGPTRPFWNVRVGGTTLGELGYPNRTVLANGQDTYWAFNALATDNPVPAYRPCTGDPAQARAFTDWFLNRVVEFQNWQIATVYAAKANPALYADPGTVAPLYPGNNMTESEVDGVVAGNLCSNTVAENDGKFPRGHMFARQINGVPDGTAITVWGTWGNNTNGTNAVLDDLADANGFDVAYENSGPGSVAKVQPTEDNCRAAFSDGPSTQNVTCYWIRYGDPGTTEFVTAIGSNP